MKKLNFTRLYQTAVFMVGGLGLFHTQAAEYFCTTIETELGWAYRIALDDKRSKLYVADYNRHVVREINLKGTSRSLGGKSLDNELPEGQCRFCSFTTVAGNGENGDSGDGGAAISAKFTFMSGVAVDKTGNLYIVDNKKRRVRKVDQRGIIRHFAGGPDIGNISNGKPAKIATLGLPTDIVIDRIGNAYIADRGHSNIRKVNTNGIITTVAGWKGYRKDEGGPKLEITGLTIDNQDHIYLVSEKEHVAKKIDPQGNITIIAGILDTPGYSGDGQLATTAQLNSPHDIAVDEDGNIFIADKLNHRIRMVDTQGIITTVVGNGQAGYKEGKCKMAQLSYPHDVEVDSLGNLYIADEGNKRIRKGLRLPDREPPIIRINTPQHQEVFEKIIPSVGGIAFDPAGGEGIDYLQLQIKKSKEPGDSEQVTFLYLNPNNNFVEEPTWLPLVTQEEWTYDTSQIPFESETTYFIQARAVDKEGNESKVLFNNQIMVTVMEDIQPPTITIIDPDPSQNIVQKVSKIQGTAFDIGTGLDRIELHITDGELYLTEKGLENKPPKSPLTITKNLGAWVYETSYLRPGGYKITAIAYDKAGNTRDDSVSILVGDPSKQHHTTLEVELDNQVIKYGGMINVRGTLNRLPNIGIYPVGEKITLKILDPKGEQVDQIETSTDEQGNFKFSNLSYFTKKGAYSLIVSFEGSKILYKTKAESQILVDESAGYAILIQGRLLKSGVPEGEEAYNKTLNRIYHHRLLKRGFAEDNIIYFNYNPKQLGVDEVPSKEKIQYHIEEWACDRINSVSAPLYIVMLDHGIKNRVLLGEEEISSTDLDQWLTQLETCLEERNPEALKDYKRVVIIGSCFSGSFIPTLSKKGKNRVIITSAQADEYAYKGRKEPDGIRSGSFFLEALFHELDQGNSLKLAFQNASSITIKYTENRPSKQHPLLDDNGDGKGGSQLSYGGDGEQIARLYLGVDNYNSALSILADKIKITPTLNLHYSETSAKLFVEVPDANQVKAVMIEVITPFLREKDIDDGISETEQKEILSDSVFLPKVANNRFEINYNPIDNLGFSECGDYKVIYTIFNRNEVPIISKHSVVHKSCAVEPPQTHLISPTDNVEISIPINLAWEFFNYPDASTVTHTLQIAEDQQFKDIVYSQEGLTFTSHQITHQAGLKSFTRYYWKVETKDGNENTSSSNIHSFDTPKIEENRLINLSTLAVIGGKAGSLTSGFIISGSDKQMVLVRGFGVDTQVNPSVVVKEYPSGNQVALNDDCGNAARYSEILKLPEHLGLPKATDACLLLDLPTGGYTVTINSPNQGMGLLGVDSINTSKLASSTKLINISSFASYGEEVSSGFILQGNDNQTVIVRGFRVDTTIDPFLVVKEYPSGKVIADNDNCVNAPRQNQIERLPNHLKVNEPSVEACLLLDLPQGAYTVTLSPIGNGGVLGVDVINLDIWQ